MMMPPPRTRPRRPMMAALRNPCMRNPIVAGPGVTQTQPQFQTAAAQTEQWWNIAANESFGTVGQAWLPASTGPMPPGAPVWVVWNGGSTGTRHYAGSSWTQPVTVLQSQAGGPTGVMVLVQPSIVPNQFYAMR